MEINRNAWRPAISRAVSVGICAAAVLGVMATPSFGQPTVPPTPREVVSDPTRFDMIPIAKPAVCDQTPQQCGRQALVALGAAGPFKVSIIRPLEETFTFRNDVVIFLYTVLGFEHDSIEGERFRVAYKRAANGLAFVQIGRQQKCVRGSNTWTKEPCS